MMEKILEKHTVSVKTIMRTERARADYTRDHISANIYRPVPFLQKHCAKHLNILFNNAVNFHVFKRTLA